jgi:hypothetical protein
MATGILPGRHVIVSGDRAGVIHVWELGTALPVQTIDVGADLRGLALVDGALVVTSTKGIMLVDLDP